MDTPSLIALIVATFSLTLLITLGMLRMRMQMKRRRKLESASSRSERGHGGGGGGDGSVVEAEEVVEQAVGVEEVVVEGSRGRSPGGGG